LPHRHIKRKREVDATPLRGLRTLCDYLSMRHFIREWRKFRGLTQVQLAERIGIDKTYLSKIESGKRRYDQPFLEAAAEVLGCAPADLIMRDPTDPEGIWSLWDNLAPVERKQLVEIGKTIRRTGTEG
jgi:transcriptional regulator with XRE-family HTH domain